MSNLIQVYNNTLTDDFCKLIINTFENDIVNQFQGETLGGIKISLKNRKKWINLLQILLLLGLELSV